MYHTEASAVIRRPMPEVFALVSDIGRQVEWQDGLIESSWTSPETARVGSTYRFVTRMAGSTMDLPGVITGWDPPSGWTWRASGGPFPVQGGFRLVDVDGGTRVTMFSDSEPKGWMSLLRPVMKRIGERGYRKSLASLKALLEAPPGS